MCYVAGEERVLLPEVWRPQPSGRGCGVEQCALQPFMGARLCEDARDASSGEGGSR